MEPTCDAGGGGATEAVDHCVGEGEAEMTPGVWGGKEDEPPGAYVGGLEPAGY